MNLDLLAYTILSIAGFVVATYIGWLMYIWWKADKIGFALCFMFIVAIGWALERVI